MKKLLYSVRRKRNNNKEREEEKRRDKERKKERNRERERENNLTVKQVKSAGKPIGNTLHFNIVSTFNVY